MLKAIRTDGRTHGCTNQPNWTRNRKIKNTKICKYAIMSYLFSLMLFALKHILYIQGSFVSSIQSSCFLFFVRWPFLFLQFRFYNYPKNSGGSNNNNNTAVIKLRSICGCCCWRFFVLAIWMFAVVCMVVDVGRCIKHGPRSLNIFNNLTPCSFLHFMLHSLCLVHVFFSSSPFRFYIKHDFFLKKYIFRPVNG